MQADDCKSISRLLPVIAELTAACTDSERSAWLLAVPYSVLLTYQRTIRDRLTVADFAAGLLYLDTCLALLRSVRTQPGHADLKRCLAELDQHLRTIIIA